MSFVEHRYTCTQNTNHFGWFIIINKQFPFGCYNRELLHSYFQLFENGDATPEFVTSTEQA
jgi:hypothetical protein